MSGSAPLAVLGGALLDPATGGRRAADLLLADGRVAAAAMAGELSVAPDAGRLDAHGLLVAPGLVDLQVNGAAGVDVTATPERLWEVAAALPRYGVTSFLPTVVTSDDETRRRAAGALAAGRPDGVPPGARPLGLHLEGPMLAPGRAGAHDRNLLRLPADVDLDRWRPDEGVAMVTLAPELPGALDAVRVLAGRGVVVSVGHTEATAAQVDAAEAAGARAVTHLFNAMPGLGHREPGPVGAVLGGGRLVAGIVLDGHHVHPRAVVAAWRALGPGRLLAVSDTTAALGLPAGRLPLGGREVVVADGAVRLAGDGRTLAGSCAGLDTGIRLLAAVTGCAAATTLAAATHVPATVLRRHDLGTLSVGARADVVLLEPSLHVVATVVAGRTVYRQGAEG